MARRVSSEELIGRQAELATITALLAGLGEPGERCLLIGGEAGVGKTRLGTELAALARSRGYTVATGACVEHGAEIVPLAAVVQVLEGLTSTGHAQVPAPPPDPATGLEPARLFQIVRRALAGAAASAPVVAIFEDLHWADESTRELVRALLPGLAGEPVLLVGTYRTDELHPRHDLVPLLASVERSTYAERIALAPLSRAEVGALAQQILGSAPDETALDTLYARGGGNPFHTEELLIDGLGSGAIPDSLRQVVLARCHALDAAASATLDAVAILSAPVDDAVLRTTSGLPVADHEAALDALAAKGLLLEGGHGLGFRHELVREVVAGELPPGTRNRLHRRAADALATLRPRQVGQIAHHRLASGDPPRALAALVAAGRGALVIGAAAEAAGHFGQALDLWERVPDAAGRAGVRHGALLRLAATASFRNRQLDRAVALGRLAAAALAEDDPAAAGEAWYELSVYLWNVAATDVAAALDRARELTLLDPPSAVSARIDHDRSHHAATRHDAVRLLTRSVDTARRAGCLGVAAAATSSLAQQHAEQGDPSGVDDLVAAIDAARDDTDITDVARAVVNLTYCLAMLGREEEIPPVFEEWTDRIVEQGLDGTTGLFLKVNTLDAYEATGGWDRAQRLVDDLLASYDQASLGVISGGLTSTWGLVLIGRGEYDLASSLFRRGYQEFRGVYYQGSWGGLLTGLVELGGRGVIPAIDDDEVGTILAHALPGEAIAAARAVATACRFRTGLAASLATITAAREWLAMVESAVTEH